MTQFEKPIFIVSAPRSGSTLLRLVLDAHPNIAVPSPAWLYEFVTPFLYSYGDISNEANFRELANDMINMPTIQQWAPDYSVDELVENCPNRTFKEAYNYLHIKVAEATGKVRWGEKSPRNGYWIKEIKADFPDAQFVHIVRDGRDQAIDISQSQSMRPCSVLMGAHFWKHYVSGITRDLAELDDGDGYTIKYESMCADPETELKKLCDFLGEDFDGQMVRHNETDNTKAWSSLGNHVATGARISTKYCEMYKTRLKGEDAQVLESVIGDLLKHYDFPLSGDPKTLPERLEAQILEADMITAPRYDKYRTDLENQRIKRKEAGVYSDDDRNSLLRSLF
jgi:LPS sulfotransferase NodH